MNWNTISDFLGTLAIGLKGAWDVLWSPICAIGTVVAERSEISIPAGIALVVIVLTIIFIAKSRKKLQ